MINIENMLTGLENRQESMALEPTRAAGVARLEQFVSRAGQYYSSPRNYDFGPKQRRNVSVLSP